MSYPVLLVLGAGGNVGASVAKTFASNGYKVALAARKHNNDINANGHLQLKADLADPSTIPVVFEKVTKAFGAPSVVVYNASAYHPVPASDVLALSPAEITQDMNVNTTSVYAAASHAVAGFATLPATAARTFIFTGNALNGMVIPAVVSLGMGKSASAHLIEAAATAYKEKGYRFFYADERNEDGSVVGNKISGEAHAEFYALLAEGEEASWLATFVRGVGFVRF